MRRARIKDVFDLQMGKTPSRNKPEYWNNGDNDWVSIRDLGSFGKYVGKTAETISEQGVVESGIKVVPANTLIMSFKLSLGKTAITVKPTYTNEAIMAFIDKGVYPIDLDYFYHQFSGRDWTAGTNKAVMGATLNKKSLGEALITVPDEREQREVAAVLDRVDGNLLLARRRLQHLDDLVKSRFVEMFGDTKRNPNNYPLVRLGDVCSILNGFAFRSSEYVNRGIRIIRIANVQKGYIEDSTPCYYPYESEPSIRKFLLEEGDLLLSLTGNVGRVGVLAADLLPAALNQRVACIRSRSSKLTVEFLFHLMNQDAFESECIASSKGMAQKNMSTKWLEAYVLPLPPLERQQAFIEFAQQVDKSRFAVQQAIEQLELLKASLMQEYFG